uniref:Uncharacterized protein n=1 Tax=Peronospora matthiolae TaxID=2874970 RepID=A0AAV1UDQ7_9STRA
MIIALLALATASIALERERLRFKDGESDSSNDPKMSRHSARFMLLCETDLLGSVVAAFGSAFVAAFVELKSPSDSPE